jgi:DNA mismatch endonuclease (patch repair protein)
MQSNVGRETKPEERLRHEIAATGATFLADARPEAALRCKADFVFPEQRVCVFVDGCFWHGCPDHFTPPKSNRDWWEEKIGANIERDLRQTEELRRLGWTVLRVWEHELTPARLPGTLERLIESLASTERRPS